MKDAAYVETLSFVNSYVIRLLNYIDLINCASIMLIVCCAAIVSYCIRISYQNLRTYTINEEQVQKLHPKD